MPANLPPQYHKAEDEFRRASTPGERLEKLREMYRLLPKHKGTEKLQSDLKQKMSRLKDELDGAKARGQEGGSQLRGAARGGRPDHPGRAAELGQELAPGGAHPCPPRGRRLSVHDQGPATGDHDVGGRSGPARRPAADLPGVLRALGPEHHPLGGRGPAGGRPGQATTWPRRSMPFSQRLAATHTELVGTLPFDVDDEAIRHVKTIVVANKADAEGAGERLEVLREFYESRFPILRVSAADRQGLETLRR